VTRGDPSEDYNSDSLGSRRKTQGEKILFVTNEKLAELMGSDASRKALVRNCRAKNLLIVGSNGDNDRIIEAPDGEKRRF
jgi:hypothetical protein